MKLRSLGKTILKDCVTDNLKPKLLAWPARSPLILSMPACPSLPSPPHICSLSLVLPAFFPFFNHSPTTEALQKVVPLPGILIPQDFTRWVPFCLKIRENSPPLPPHLRKPFPAPKHFVLHKPILFPYNTYCLECVLLKSSPRAGISSVLFTAVISGTQYRAYHFLRHLINMH